MARIGGPRLSRGEGIIITAGQGLQLSANVLSVLPVVKSAYELHSQMLHNNSAYARGVRMRSLKDGKAGNHPSVFEDY